MSSSKSLPSSFKQNKRPIFYNNSTISRVTIEGGSHSSSNSSDQIQTAYKDIYSSSFSSSNVKISSPLTKPAWFQHEGDVTVHTNSSGTTSDKSWMTRRWSTVSGSLIARRKNKKTTASRLWTSRQKRRTFPPSTDILKRERKKFALPPAVPPINKKHHRQSLQDILTTFYNVANSGSGGGLGGGMDGNESASTPTTTSSSSMSKRLGRILKKRGKQPYNNKHKKKPMLTINTHTKYTEDELKAAMMSMFQPPATISSKSSTPSSPLRFPTPPKRFSAYYIDSQGKSGKVDYKHKMTLSHHVLQFIQHGIFSPHAPPSDPLPPPSSLEKGYYKAYNRQLLLNTSLFFFGFIFFPCWWVGAWLYYKRQRSGSMTTDGMAEDVFYEHDLFSIRTIVYLNTVFSCLSFVLVAVVVALVIWLVKS
ncbi:MFS domain-containing protein [Mucor velutinosus]|uniref:MFS domain-containing protein n=1 Tax=Mucor velutinosus TaxID=708070 RepID=A0AAN7I298_9FUNG|nr:MFS domain-containing protein [Mucor velutinosus]